MAFHTTVQLGESAMKIGIAAPVIGAWLALHIHALWSPEMRNNPFVAVFLGLVWLSFGLFIAARDAMRVTAGPESRREDFGLGQLLLALYARFPWRTLFVQSRAGHRLEARELLVLGSAVAACALLSGPRWPDVALWAVPSILASVLLLIFGPWLAHRAMRSSFADGQDARLQRVSAPVPEIRRSAQ